MPFYTYIYYICSNPSNIEGGGNHNFVNNINSFIPIEPKIDIESDLVVFLYYWKIISIHVLSYNRYKILNLFSESSRFTLHSLLQTLCPFFSFSIYSPHWGLIVCSYVAAEFSSHLSFVVLRSPFTVLSLSPPFSFLSPFAFAPSLELFSSVHVRVLLLQNFSQILTTTVRDYSFFCVLFINHHCRFGRGGSGSCQRRIPARKIRCRLNL